MDKNSIVALLACPQFCAYPQRWRVATAGWAALQAGRRQETSLFRPSQAWAPLAEMCPRQAHFICRLSRIRPLFPQFICGRFFNQPAK